MRKQVKKEGFTLIELLAVIVILGVLALIATPFILGVVESARKGAAVNSAYGYVDAIEKSSLQDMIDKGDYQNKKNGTYNAETIKPVKYKGADPLDVCVTIENGEVTAGSFQFGKYVVDYIGGKASVNEQKENAGCGGNSETPGEEPKTPEDLKDDTKIKNGENYYIGANPNNWVVFGRADESDNKSLLMWRIVKIDNVGIKMVYEGIQNGEQIPLEDGRALLNGTMGVAWNSDASNFWNTSDLKEKLSTWLSRIAVLDLEKYVASTTWKIGGIPDLNPTPLRSFLESGGIDSVVDSRNYQGVTSYQSPIGMISPWDYMYTSSNEECSKSYVSAGTSNECSLNGNGTLNNFLYKNKYSYWTMNAVSSAGDQAWNITNSGIIASRQTNYSIYSVRPVLNLKLDTKFLTGDGTIENPYIVEDYLANLFVKPELKLNGDKVVVIHQGDTYLDAGASAYDEQDGDITSKITVESNLDNQKLGRYTITYNVQDSDSNKAIPITRTVQVVDKDTPVITLNGENPTEVIIGSTYTEPGYTVSDPNYGDISTSVTIEGSVDTSTLGIYYLTYRVKNQDGLEAVPVERRVIVKASVPTITLNGSSLTLVDVGTSYNEEGATATDSYYGDLTGSITTRFMKYNDTSKNWESVSNIDPNVAGSYKVRYTVTNQFGANAYADRVVQVVRAAGPTITYTPSSDETSKKGHSTKINVTKKTYDVVSSSQKYFTINTLTGFTSPGTLAGFESMFKTSYQNGSTLSISKGTGKYYFYAIAKDIYQDTTYQKSGLFQMDHSAPVITLNSGISKILLGRTYSDPGATAYDQHFDGDLTSQITTQNNVDTSKEGTYQVIYKVSDSAGNETTKVRNVIVYHSVPTIGLLGGSKVRVQYGSTYTEPGYTAKDEADGDITSQVTVTGTVDTSKEGSYTLTYSVKNSSGKETTKKRTVEVYIPSPVITLKGETPIKIKVKTTYVDEGATAIDEIDGDLTSKITTTSNIDTNVEGTYEIVYQVTNNLGKTATSKRTVIVYSEAPTIILKGDSPTILYKGQTFEEAGYTATDEVDGDITDKVTVSGSVDTTLSGTYTLFYEVTNSYGKKTVVKRSVIVRASNMVITLNGDSTVTLLRGTPYTEAGYTASDELEGDITSSVLMDLGGLDINKAGTYTITYTAKNSGGDTTSEKRTVIIRKPELVVILKGVNSLTLLRGTTYTEAGYTATDEVDGDVTSSVTMDLGGLDINKAGTYTITYTAKNSGGDTTSEKRTVIIRKPELVVTLNGESRVELLKGSTYTDLGATATDEVEGDITNKITVNLNGLNTNLPGTYKVLYKVINSGGDEATATRTVVVRNPKVEITLKGNSTVEVPIGYPYSDEGATATDELLGDVSSSITIEHNVNTNILGTYQVTYTVVSSGVTATKVRSVKVTPLAGPLVTFETNGNGTYQKENSTKVTVTKNNYDVIAESLSYLWTTSLVKPSEASFKEHFTSEDILKTPGSVTGKYYLWVLAKDTYGNTTIVPSNSFNLDNTAPVLSLIGNKLVEVPADGEYQDRGVSVVERDSGLNEEGVVVTSNVISGVIGTYQVIYTATDKVGNVAVPVKRTVSIIEASLKDAPGEGYVKKYDTSYFVGENPNNYVVFGNAAENNYDYIPIYWRIVKADDSGIKIVYEGIKEGSSIKQNGTIGTYSYDTVSNDFNRPADITTVLNNFYTNLKDEDKDTLTKAINWCVGSTPSPYNMDAFKAEECKTLSTNKSVVGLLSGLDYMFTTEAACDAYNQASCGSQNFLKKSYNYFTMSSDSESSVSEFIVNSNGALTRTEVTSKENIRPVINLRPDVLIKGGEGTLEKPYQLNSRVPVSDTAAPTVAFSPNTATGNLDGVEVLVSDDISGVDNESLRSVWTTNTTQPSVDKFINSFSNGDKILVPEEQSATYYLWILARDRKGNQSITRSGLYKIDNVPPVITIKGDNPFAQKPGQAYVDAGATATDAIDGTVSVQTTTNVNPSVEGTYQVVYTATDKTGNKATAIRTVIIGYLEIKTPEDFYNIRNSIKADYKVMNDIDFTDSQWKDNFPVITNFYGTLDGNGKKLIGLKISGNGIFTTLNSGVEIKNIQFVGFENNAPTIDNVGSITGYLNQTITLTGISLDSTSKIEGRTMIGGLVGAVIAPLTIENSSFSGTVNSTITSGNSNIGGLIGSSSKNLVFNNCFMDGSVTGMGSYVGGLIGNGTDTVINNSYVNGTITGYSYTGGLAGKSTSIEINNSYTRGNITVKTGGASTGGLVGTGLIKINRSYSESSIQGYNTVGGLVGSTSGGSIKESYFSGDLIGSGSWSGGIFASYGGGSSLLVNNVFVAGSVTGTSGSGGLFGSITSPATINNAYMLGKLTNAKAILYSGTPTSITNTYWISETTGVYTSSYGTVINSLGQAMNSGSYSGFDFNNIWGIESGQTTPYIREMMIPDKNYLKNIEHFEGEGSGTEQDPYLIKTPEDFYNIRLSPGSYYKIMNNVDMTTSQWRDNFPQIPEFLGVIDGNNKKIIGLKVTGTGLFGELYSGVTLKNMEFASLSVDGTNLDNVGGLLGTANYDNILLDGVKIDSNSSIVGKNFVGGMIGYNYKKLTITNSINQSAVTSIAKNAGGMIGYMPASGEVQISNSKNEGNVTGTSQVGGFIANTVGTVTISLSENSGEIKGYNNVGGLIGYASGPTTTIETSTNRGIVTGTSSSGSVGGIVGWMSGGSITSSANEGSISAYIYVGGLIGYINSTSTINSSYNTGNITATGSNSYLGGLVGNGYVTIENSYSDGTLTGKSYLGGLVGTTSGGSISKSYFSGSITGASYVGGIVGSGSSTISDTYVVGDVSATNINYSGGLVGQLQSGTVTNSYVQGKLTTAQAIFGTKGNGTLTNIYWIGETTGVYSGTYGTMINSLSQAVNSSSYTGFDFNTVWGMELGQTTPYLRGMVIPNQNYLENLPHFEGEGSGTEQDPYLIKTAIDFYNIRNSSGSYYKIVNDIDFTNSEWNNNFPQIPDFFGTIDGNNKNIIGIKVNGTGLFGTLYAGATLKNIEFVSLLVDGSGQNGIGGITGTINNSNITLNQVKIDSTSEIKGNSNVGGFVGILNKEITINNVTNSSKITATSSSIGGIVGYVNTNQSLNYVKNIGSIVSTWKDVGGLVGYVNTGKLTINNSTNEGEVMSRFEVGGFVGNSTTIVSIENSQNSGNVTATDGNAEITGGLVGIGNTVTIKNSENSGQVTGRMSMGGFVGSATTATILDSNNSGIITTNGKTGTSLGGFIGKITGQTVVSGSFNSAKIEGSWNLGGLIGEGNNATISASYNTGTITGASKVGGLLGTSNGSKLEFTSTYNTGSVTGSDGERVGGIIGYAAYTTIKDSYNTGDITGLGSGSGVGGIIGYCGNNSTISKTFSSGIIKGYNYVGGLSGNMSNSGVNQSYFDGTVSGNSYIGGIVGYNYYSTISNAYMAGTVTGTGTAIGGITGYSYGGTLKTSYVLGNLINAQAIAASVNGGVLSNVYWIKETTGVATSSYGTMIETKAQAIQKNNYSAFDFDTIWNMEEGQTTPYLRGLPIPDQIYIGG